MKKYRKTLTALVMAALLGASMLSAAVLSGCSAGRGENGNSNGQGTASAGPESSASIVDVPTEKTESAATESGTQESKGTESEATESTAAVTGSTEKETPETEADTKADTKAETDADTKPETDAETETDTERDPEAGAENGSGPETGEDDLPLDLSITVLNVGNGLAILLKSNGHYMLYDGGGSESSSFVVSYLMSEGVTALDYIVVSHYDEDHISGLVGALNRIPTAKVLRPAYEADTKIYRSLVNKITANGAEEVFPNAGDTYRLGSASFTFLTSAAADFEKENDRSLVIRIECGSFSCLLTGDAEAACELQLLKAPESLRSTIYVAGHHGSNSSSSERFMAAVQPEAAVISVGSYNDYGHPGKKTMALFESLALDVYRTDRQGSITVTTDGVIYSFDAAPCNDYTPGETLSTDEDPDRGAGSGDGNDGNGSGGDGTNGDGNSGDGENEDSYIYLGNLNSMKFHLRGCAQGETMKAENRFESNLSREEMLERGFVPCKNCNP